MEPGQSASGEGRADLERAHDENSSTADEARSAPTSAAAEGHRLAEEQKETGAERLSAAAQAMEGAADRLQGDMPQASEFVHDMAQRLDATAASLREKNLDELIRQGRDFARQQPGMFFAGAVLSGLALARFLKSSATQQKG